MKIKKKQKGITLIALVITIIVLLILAGISINTLFGRNGLLGKSEEAKFKNKMATIAEEWNLHVMGYQIGESSVKNKKEVYAGGDILKEIILDEEIEIEEEKIQDIKKIAKEVGSEEEKYVIGFEGELYYVSQEKIPNNEKQEKWCEEIGIKIWDFKISSGIKIVNGNYEKVNETYLCTPKINTGFVKEKTRYILEENGSLKPGTWINKRPVEGWYDYGERRWANLYVESEGRESYYVWIPRYVYKIGENQRTDVKFVDINNNYTDGKTDQVTKWETLEAEGYRIPEAFYFGDNDNYKENEPIPGYWVSKYQLSELSEYIVDYSTTVTPSTMTIKDLKTNTTKNIAKYTYAVNGKIVYESKTAETYKLTGLAKGNKVLNVTALDENGNIVGSMTRTFETADVNPPDLTGFDKDTTFYVYWDENGIEHNEIPISQEPPDEWYDYSIRRWANIVTRNNNLESYFVWIPRYQYTLDTVNQRTYIKFIQGAGEATENGYRVPEAFQWGDSNEVPLTGYWMSKYQLSESGQKMNAEITAGGKEIRVQEITGSAITEGLKYEYYLNGRKVHEGKDAKEKYIYENLEGNKTYTVNIIARNASSNAFVAALTKKVETIGGNAPDLTGYNENVTYYVLYDDNGNRKIGDKIKNNGSNMPKNWYDYSMRKWANIVVTDGKVEKGEITGGSYQNYFVWIPRYQYSLDTTNQRTNVKFIDGVGSETQSGYRIPEAFSWGDNNEVPLKGYWISKYQLSN